jgi:hypothetical protein
MGRFLSEADHVVLLQRQDAGSAADANVFDHLVMMAPMHDCLHMAAVMAMVAAILAIVTIVILHVLVVAILFVVILPVMAANDDLAVIVR